MKHIIEDFIFGSGFFYLTEYFSQCYQYLQYGAKQQYVEWISHNFFNFETNKTAVSMCV